MFTLPLMNTDYSKMCNRQQKVEHRLISRKGAKSPRKLSKNRSLRLGGFACKMFSLLLTTTDYSKMCTRQQYLEQSAISPYLSVRAQRSNLHSYLEIASGKMRPRNDRISFTLPLMNTEYSKMLCFH